MTDKITITMSKEQAEVVAEACKVYKEILYGDFAVIVGMFTDPDSNGKPDNRSLDFASAIGYLNKASKCLFRGQDSVPAKEIEYLLGFAMMVYSKSFRDLHNN